MSDAVIIEHPRVCDAPEYVRVHTECLIETYGSIMPSDFAQRRRDEIPAYIERRTAEFHSFYDALDKGRTPERSFWVTRTSDRKIVGLASSGPTRAPWEHAEGFPAPPIDHQLDHIYTLARVHGTGIGQRLLDTALPNGMGAHLWILGGNERAQSFYRRNGFVLDDIETECGPAWNRHPLYRMWRPDPSPGVIA